MCWVIKIYITNVDLKKCSQAVQSTGGGGHGSFGKVPKLVLLFWCSFPKGTSGRGVCVWGGVKKTGEGAEGPQQGPKGPLSPPQVLENVLVFLYFPGS